VRLPVAAFDDWDHFDPTVSAADLLVLEDGVPQTVRSIDRRPARVLVVFDMGAQVTSTRSGRAARDAALRLFASLREGDEVAAIQNGGRVEQILDWTDDREAAARALERKFFGANRSRLSECLAAAAAKLRGEPAGNTHVVVFTDGFEQQTRERVEAAAINRTAMHDLVATQASVHVFCFAALVSEKVRARNRVMTAGTADGKVSVRIDLDFEMRRWFRAYARAAEERERQLTALADEAGGRVLLPLSPEDTARLAERVARDIAAQYVITYAPSRPFTPGDSRDRRRVEVRPRRSGLRLVTLRTAVSASAQN
jgi:hypothetical protein